MNNNEPEKTKRNLIILLLIICCIAFSGKIITSCSDNATNFLDEFKFNYAYISLPNGQYIQGYIERLIIDQYSNQMQVTIDGLTYLTDTTRCVLITNKPYKTNLRGEPNNENN